MKQTAMEELIHDFKMGKFTNLSVTKSDNLLKKYLEKEKKQMKESWNDGFSFQSQYKNFEEYYNNIYKSEL